MPLWRKVVVAVPLKPFSWDRMIEAVEAVRERMLRATAALRDAEIPYAVAAGIRHHRRDLAASTGPAPRRTPAATDR